jgi:hypothetical protein
MGIPSFCHWYVNVPVPDATTLKVAVDPMSTVEGDGWRVTAGGGGFTVIVGTTRQVPPVLVADTV